MSDNIRIKTTPGGGEKRVNLDINQKFDFIEILSLKISQDEAYRRFCSDYGVVVGRVIVNNGLGVPNAKVSIFIPVDEADLEDPEISGLYPYEITTDTDSDGISYNLLPRNNRGKDDCFTPVGTFPSKREIQDNPEIGELYCKYYKFTTTTNESGDFMFFGVPVGTHFMHVDADISDIGFLSQRPYDLIRDGANEKSFNSPTKFKGRGESATLNQIKTTTPMSVTVPPFWGDTEQCQIGIARADINLATTITPSAIFMGSLVSDNDKHALSRTCVPRKKLGKMDELVTGEGRIEMIRKTPKNGIERFDVEGGQVIDSDGVWAYQIPMNRDHLITAEDGTLVPSGDPSKGIPTTARVRFRIGMNIEGDEGKLRTRAKYLVPHNPKQWSETDFSFDTTTSDKHFTDLSWNKIYTVKNHITRVQPRGGAENRNFIGFKNVDDSKDKNPIPFNKLDNDLNPLFFILCVIIRIIARLVGVINSIIIPLINLIIYTLNLVLLAVCEVLFFIGKLVCLLEYALCVKDCDNKRTNCRRQSCLKYKRTGDVKDCPGECKNCNCTRLLDYVPYITLKCSASEGKEYAPGSRTGPRLCKKIGDFEANPYCITWNATYEGKQADGTKETKDFHYASIRTSTMDPDAPDHYMVNGVYSGLATAVAPPYCNAFQLATTEGCDAGWSKCQTAALADALDVFKFDFYNDWINGTLYPFLLKYKVKKRGTGRERFCEVDCDDWPGEGVDNDGKNGSDNPCKNNKIVDTCTKALPQNVGINVPFIDSGVNSDERIKIRSGYIKKYENELYYTPISRDGDNKLFATDIVNLGSVFDCDWEGKPKFYQYLVDTTFNIPPLLPEYDTVVTANGKEQDGTKVVSGFDGGARLPGAPLWPLPGSLIGRLSCFGLNTDGNSCNNLKRLCELGVGLDEDRGPTSPVDAKISNQDVEQDYVRGVFTYLNTPGATQINPVFLDSQPTTPSGYSDYQDPYYSAFRVKGGITPSNTSFWNKKIWVYDNSYYFYFGLNKGKTALSKMKEKYFTECTVVEEIDFYIVATDITEDGPASTGDGKIEVLVIGGVGPFTYLWSGGPTIGSTTYPINKNIKDISGLYAGEYTLTVTDSAGNVTSNTFIVPGPVPVNCNVQSIDASNNGVSDGEITVSVSNGVGPYTIELNNYDVTTSTGTKLFPTLSSVSSPIGTTFNNLGAGTYIVTVTDRSTPATKCENIITITEPTALTLNLKFTNVTCFGGNDGSLFAEVSGGVGPYSILWSDGTTFKSLDNLSAGINYSVTVTDSNSNSVTANKTLTQGSNINFNINTTNGNCSTGPAKGIISVTGISGGAAPYKVNVKGGDISINVDANPDSSGNALFTNIGNGTRGTSYIVTVEDNNGCSVSKDVEVFVPATALSVGISSDSANPATLTATINGGIFNSDSSAGDIYEYVLTLQKYNGTSWDNIVTNTINTGTSSYTLTANTGATYRYIVKDKSGQSGGCAAESSTIVV